MRETKVYYTNWANCNIYIIVLCVFSSGIFAVHASVLKPFFITCFRFKEILFDIGMSVFKNRLAKIKLSANESALGPSPKAKKEYIKVSKSFARYPDTNGTFLRET